MRKSDAVFCHVVLTVPIIVFVVMGLVYRFYDFLIAIIIACLVGHLAVHIVVVRRAGAAAILLFMGHMTATQLIQPPFSIDDIMAVTSFGLMLYPLGVYVITGRYMWSEAPNTEGEG